MNREKNYALYRGEKFLGIGTKKELAELLGVKVEKKGQTRIKPGGWFV